VKELTPKQELFVIEYAKDFNATQAAIRAGYSPKTASEQGSRLLGKVKHLVQIRQEAVKAEAAKSLPESVTRTNRGIATLEQSLRLCTAMAFGDPRKLFDEHNNCKPVAELSKVQALMVAGFEVEETFTKVGDKAEHTGYVKRFRMADRAPYVNMLLKFHGAFPSSKQPLPGPKDVTPRFDPKNLTPEEWEQAKALLSKMQVRAIDHAS